MTLLTTKEVAERLGVIDRRVRQMIDEGKLAAEKCGRDWVINSEDVDTLMKARHERPQDE